MGKNGNLIVGLDLGTTKTCVIVGEVHNGGIDVIGFASVPSKGLRKGMVINIESTVDSISKVIEEAELMSGCKISAVYTGIAGSHIKGINSHGVIGIKDSEVTKDDISRVIEAAKAIAIPLDREIIHILPQEFIVDEQNGIHEPLGMAGVRLEANVHMVTGAASSAQNIIKCANRNGLVVKELVLQPLASSESTLEDDERELGVVLVDIGGGTTDIALLKGGSIRYTSVLALGGDHITSDIAVGLRTSLKQAEELKLHYGSTLEGLTDKNEIIEIPLSGGTQPRKVSRQFLCQIIQSRVEEIFKLVHREILRSGYRELMAPGVVLTGGTSLLDGIGELGEQILDLPLRVGYPNTVGGLSEIVKSPLYATAVGLILYGRKHASNGGTRTQGYKNIFTRITQGTKNWLAEVI
jgi:cell division protein FtsA